MVLVARPGAVVDVVVVVVAVVGPAGPAGRPAMADVERIAGGRRAVSLLLLLLLPPPTDESCRSRPAAVAAAAAAASPFSVALLGCRAKVEVGVGVFAEEAEKEAAGGLVREGVRPDDEEEGVTAAAEDCARWRTASSAGLLRRSWLLEARWPGVCERGIGGARSGSSETS
jgi:hypothetical protein